MAPRMPESPDAYVERLQAAAKNGERIVPFGVHHYSHVSCLEDGVWRLRRWVMNPQRVDEYRAQHSSFMPEHAEMLSDPGPDVLLEAPTLAAYIKKLRRRWPL